MKSYVICSALCDLHPELRWMAPSKTTHPYSVPCFLELFHCHSPVIYFARSALPYIHTAKPWLMSSNVSVHHIFCPEDCTILVLSVWLFEETYQFRLQEQQRIIVAHRHEEDQGSPPSLTWHISEQISKYLVEHALLFSIAFQNGMLSS